MTKHIPTAARTSALLDVAVQQAQRHGWRALTRDQVAEAAGVSTGLVSARLGTMDALRRSVMRAAVQRRIVPIVAEGLLARDKHAGRADEELRLAVANWLSTRVAVRA